MAPGRNRERTAAGRRRHPGGTALAGSSSFETAKAKLPDQRLALLYLDVGRLLGAIAARAPAQSAQLEQIRTLYGLSGVRPVAATPDSVGVESAMTTTGQRPLAQPAASGGALLAGAPSDAWLVPRPPGLGRGRRPLRPRHEQARRERRARDPSERPEPRPPVDHQDRRRRAPLRASGRSAGDDRGRPGLQRRQAGRAARPGDARARR